MLATKPLEKYVHVNENNELSIEDGRTLNDILYKLCFYEWVEEKIHIGGSWAIFGKYSVLCQNYDEYLRTCHAYNLSVSSLLKNVPEVTSRTTNALKRAGIEKVMDLIESEVRETWSIIDKVPGVGDRQYQFIRRAIRKLERWCKFGETDDGMDFYNLEE